MKRDAARRAAVRAKGQVERREAVPIVGSEVLAPQRMGGAQTCCEEEAAHGLQGGGTVVRINRQKDFDRSL